MDLNQYLREALDAERESAKRLTDAIARTSRADHRVHLESHLAKERKHADQLEARLRERQYSQGALGTLTGLVEGVVNGGLELVSAPLGLLRGSASPDETLRTAEELAASEAREVARYTALERLGKRYGDDKTARVARSIRRQEEDQLDLLRREIPRLADHVLGDEVAPPEPRPRRKPPARRRPARRRPAAAEASSPSRRPRTHADTAGPDRAEAARIREQEREAEGEGPGPDLHVAEPWPGYASMSAADVAARVAKEPEPVRAAVRLYEAANDRREVVMRATSET